MHDDILYANPEKLITKLIFKKGASGSYAGVFAICGLTASGVGEAPVVSQATEVVKSTSFTANWASVDEAAGYRLDVAKDADFTDLLADYNNLDAADVTS